MGPGPDQNTYIRDSEFRPTIEKGNVKNLKYATWMRTSRKALDLNRPQWESNPRCFWSEVKRANLLRYAVVSWWVNLLIYINLRFSLVTSKHASQPDLSFSSPAWVCKYFFNKFGGTKNYKDDMLWLVYNHCFRGIIPIVSFWELSLSSLFPLLLWRK